jgi:hypothetical protein
LGRDSTIERFRRHFGEDRHGSIVDGGVIAMKIYNKMDQHPVKEPSLAVYVS